MTQRQKDTPPPAPDQPVDPRGALAYALEQQRMSDRVVHMLRAFVDADSAMKGLETKHSDLARRSEELERELPALIKRVTDAREAAAQAEKHAQDAYEPEAKKMRTGLEDERLRLVARVQEQEAKLRELERTYASRQTALAQETAEAEKRLAKINEDFATIVARHAR